MSQYFLPQRRVRYLGVKLDAINTAFRTFNGRDDLAGRRGRLKSVGQPRDMVTVAHPDVQLEGELVKYGRLAAQNLELCMAVFTPRRRLTRSSEIDGDELHAVANTEDRDINFLVKIRLDPRRVLVRHPPPAAGEDHSLLPFRRHLVSRKMK